MRVLLTGTESCGIDVVERSLRADGHETFSCTDGPGAACQALSDPARCPMAAGIDVIVVARQHPLPHLTARERLVGCARLTSVPLIVAGSTVINPFGARAVSCIEGFDDIVEGVAALGQAEAVDLTIGGTEVRVPMGAPSGR